MELLGIITTWGLTGWAFMATCIELLPNSEEQSKRANKEGRE